jgi:hypothetical protein
MTSPCRHFLTGIFNDTSKKCPHCEIDELRAELAALKNQEPCAAMPRCNIEGAGICKCADDRCNDLVDVYLAPGAQQKEGA